MRRVRAKSPVFAEQDRPLALDAAVTDWLKLQMIISKM